MRLVRYKCTRDNQIRGALPAFIPSVYLFPRSEHLSFALVRRNLEEPAVISHKVYDSLVTYICASNVRYWIHDRRVILQKLEICGNFGNFHMI